MSDRTLKAEYQPCSKRTETADFLRYGGWDLTLDQQCGGNLGQPGGEATAPTRHVMRADYPDSFGDGGQPRVRPNVPDPLQQLITIFPPEEKGSTTEEY